MLVLIASRATKAHASLRIYNDSPEPSLHAYIAYGHRGRLIRQFRTQAQHDTSAWAFKGGFCVYAACADTKLRWRGFHDNVFVAINVFQNWPYLPREAFGPKGVQLLLERGLSQIF